MILKIIISMLMLIIVLLAQTSCAAVKPYQKVYLNQEDMSLSGTKLDGFDENFQTYREGASGALGGKVGGGCGCN